MRPVVTHVVQFVCASVCVYLLVTGVSPANTAEPTEMLFTVWTHRGPKNHVMDGGGHGSPTTGRGILGGLGVILGHEWDILNLFRKRQHAAIQSLIISTVCSKLLMSAACVHC